MTTRKVLIIVNEFPPMGGGGVMRAAKFVKYLPQFGWEPWVVTCDYQGNGEFLDPSLLEEVERSGARIVSVKSLDPNGLKKRIKRSLQPIGPVVESRKASAQVWIGGFLRRLKNRLESTLFFPDRHVVWTIAALQAARTLVVREGIDVVVTTSPPTSTHLVGRALKRAFPHLRWIADFRDLWSLSPDMERLNGLQRARHARLEHEILKEADEVIYVSGAILRETRQRFALPQGKGTVITNGFDAEDFVGVLAHAGPAFTVAYVGSILGVRAQNRLLEGLERFVELSGLEPEALSLKFVGSFEAAYRARMEPLRRQGFLEAISSVTHDEALRHMAGADVLVLILPDCQESRVAYTGKFFEYLAARRPILALTPPGAVSEVIDELSIGQVVAPNDPEAIAKALALFHAQFSSGSFGRLAIPLGDIARFERRTLTGQLAALLEARAR